MYILWKNVQAQFYPFPFEAHDPTAVRMALKGEFHLIRTGKVSAFGRARKFLVKIGIVDFCFAQCQGSHEFSLHARNHALGKPVGNRVVGMHLRTHGAPNVDQIQSLVIQDQTVGSG